MKIFLQYSLFLMTLVMTNYPALKAEPMRSYIVGEIPIKKPGYITVTDKAGKKGIWISSFGSKVQDKLTFIPEIRNNWQGPPSQFPTYPLTWPNGVHKQSKAISAKQVWAVPSGFFSIPIIKNEDRTGSVYLVWLEDNKIQSSAITDPEPSWFYHKISWRDMDGDGLLDIVTARSNFNPFRKIFGRVLSKRNKVRGELLWFRQPNQGALTAKWESHKITEGPDVYFKLIDLDQDGLEEVIATESFQGNLSVYWQKNDLWQKRIINSTLGTLFGMEIKDLNGDGNKDLVVTNHENTEKAGVFAFEIPKDFRHDPWPIHPLLTGIKTRKDGKGEASPGGTYCFKIDPKSKTKPWILVSGDGSKRIHLLIPKNQEKNQWSYSEHILLETKNAITGKIDLLDLDHDNIPEILVPEYEDDKIGIISIKKFTTRHDLTPNNSSSASPSLVTPKNKL